MHTDGHRNRTPSHTKTLAHVSVTALRSGGLKGPACLSATPVESEPAVNTDGPSVGQEVT